MLQNLNIAADLASEFLLLRKEMLPKEAREDELKAALRPFGAAEYPTPGVGLVKVSAPSIAKKTGTKLVVDETKIADVDPAIFASLLNKGLLRYEEVWSRASASKVEAKFND